MGASLQEATIIVVDDDSNSMMATIEILKLHGVEDIHSFSSGSKMLKEVDNFEKVDLFLLDIHMPGETGYDVVTLLQGNPKFSSSKTVALTAGVLVDDIRRAKRAGFNSLIGKPIKPTQFGQQVQRVLDGEKLWEWR